MILAVYGIFGGGLKLRKYRLRWFNSKPAGSAGGLLKFDDSGNETDLQILSSDAISERRRRGMFVAHGTVASKRRRCDILQKKNTSHTACFKPERCRRFLAQRHSAAKPQPKKLIMQPGNLEILLIVPGFLVSSSKNLRRM